MDGIEKVETIINKLQALKTEGIRPIIKRSFEQIAPTVEDFNLAQLARGERGDGESLPLYSIVSVTKFGKRPGPMTLHDQGDYYRGKVLEVYDDGIEIKGTDIKSEMLELRYGDEINDLQEGSKEAIAQDYLLPVAFDEVLLYLLP